MVPEERDTTSCCSCSTLVRSSRDENLLDREIRSHDWLIPVEIVAAVVVVVVAVVVAVTVVELAAIVAVDDSSALAPRCSTSSTIDWQNEIIIETNAKTKNKNKTHWIDFRVFIFCNFSLDIFLFWKNVIRLTYS